MESLDIPTMLRQLVCQYLPHFEQSIFSTLWSEIPQGQVSVLIGNTVLGDVTEVTLTDNASVSSRVEGSAIGLDGCVVHGPVFALFFALSLLPFYLVTMPFHGPVFALFFALSLLPFYLVAMPFLKKAHFNVTQSQK